MGAKNRQMIKFRPLFPRDASISELVLIFGKNNFRIVQFFESLVFQRTDDELKME